MACSLNNNLISFPYQLVASLEPEGTRLNPNEEKELRSQIASAETRLQKMKNDWLVVGWA